MEQGVPHWGHRYELWAWRRGLLLLRVDPWVSAGFLGAFLLSELLEKTRAVVYCAVRAKSKEAAANRLKQNLLAHMLWKGRFEGRIVPVLADLALVCTHVCKRFPTEF